MTTTNNNNNNKPVLRFPEGAPVVPGDRLGTIRQVRPGTGTYVKNGHLYATLAGQIVLVPMAKTTSQDDEQEEEEEEEKYGVDATMKQRTSSSSSSLSPSFVCNVVVAGVVASAHVLRPHQLVLGTAMRITPQSAVVEIRVAQGVGALSTYQEGAIRIEDIRSGSTAETIVLADCFRPGDLVAARVISLGDSRRYFLSTAETELGVIRAMSSSSSGSRGNGSMLVRNKEGQMLVPVSWKEMEDPTTGVREPRKVAKPLNLSAKTTAAVASALE